MRFIVKPEPKNAWSTRSILFCTRTIGTFCTSSSTFRIQFSTASNESRSVVENAMTQPAAPVPRFEHNAVESTKHAWGSAALSARNIEQCSVGRTALRESSGVRLKASARAKIRGNDEAQ